MKNKITAAIIVILIISLSFVSYKYLTREINIDQTENILSLKQRLNQCNQDIHVKNDAKEIYKEALQYMDKEPLSKSYEAVYLFIKSAELGHPNARFAIAQLYMNGKYLTPDYTKATYWLDKAGEDGIPVADLQLGSIYALGNGISKDAKKATQYLGRAASNDKIYDTDIFQPMLKLAKTDDLDDQRFEEFIFKTMEYAEANYNDGWYRDPLKVISVLPTGK